MERLLGVTERFDDIARMEQEEEEGRRKEEGRRRPNRPRFSREALHTHSTSMRRGEGTQIPKLKRRSVNSHFFRRHSRDERKEIEGDIRLLAQREERRRKVLLKGYER